MTAPALPTELHTQQFDEIFTRFSHVIRESTWKQRVANNMLEYRRNPLLAQYLEEEFVVANALARCSELKASQGIIKALDEDSDWMYPAMSFAAQALFMIGRATGTERNNFVGRVRDSIRDSDKMRALQLELGVASHFVRRGQSISWPEMDGLGTFDLLLANVGSRGLEVECKSASPDKGRRIPRREAIEFYQHIYSDLKELTRTIDNHLSVVLTLPGRLPTSVMDKKALAKATIRQIISGHGATIDGNVDIRIQDIPKDQINWIENGRQPDLTREKIESLTQTRNRPTVIAGTLGGGLIILVVQSAQDDSLLRYVHDTLSESAKKQFTKSRPGMFVVGFSGIGVESMIRLAEQDNSPGGNATALTMAVSKFLSTGDRDHVVGVSFNSKSELSPNVGFTDSGGSAYFFANSASSYWDECFRGLFRST